MYKKLRINFYLNHCVIFSNLYYSLLTETHTYWLKRSGVKLIWKIFGTFNMLQCFVSTSGILSTKIHVLGRTFLSCIMLLTCLISYFYLNYLITSHPYHHKSWIERKYLKLPSAFITLSVTLYHCMNHLITGTVSKKSNEGSYFKNEREKSADLVLVIKF